MPKHYPLYEAKAKLSALVREVREGGTIVITVHGEPVAELRPIPPERPQTLKERIAELRATGQVAEATLTMKEALALQRAQKPKPVPGGLQRFLDDRNRWP
jgi:prevent-host-death family protein